MGKFYVISEFAELLDVAMHLKYVEKQDVLMSIPDKEYRKIGEGIIDKEERWWRMLGQGYTWIIDGCENADLQEWLRDKGEAVFGTSVKGAKLEENRQLGQALFRRMGLYQPESVNFKDINKALEFIKKRTDKKFIMKQNGNAPKSLNHKTKFDSGEDMVYHLEQLKKKWNEAEFGAFDCDFMEQVEGTEIAISAFFNGKEFLRNKDGQIAAFINFEHKKESNDDLGDTTGETGTVFIVPKGKHKLVNQLLENKELVNVLQKTKFRGVFDINGCLTDKGYVGFEPTMRPGIPSSSYEFLSGAGLQMRTSDMMSVVAHGENKILSLTPGVGIVLVVSSRPYPVEAQLPPEATSQGEKLWLIKNKKIVQDFDTSQRLHIHLQNFYKKDGSYLVATSNGYLYTLTMSGKTVKETREKAIAYIKDNTYISGIKYRTDIGAKVEKLGY